MTSTTGLYTLWRGSSRHNVELELKHQYVGDIKDYRRYALLRALSAGQPNSSPA